MQCPDHGRKKPRRLDLWPCHGIANLNQPWRYPLVNIQKAIENCHLVRGFTYIKNRDFPVRYVDVYQAGYPVFLFKKWGEFAKSSRNVMTSWCPLSDLMLLSVFVVPLESTEHIFGIHNGMFAWQDAVECESPCNCLFWAVWFVLNFVIVVESTCLRCCLIGWLVGWLVGPLMRFAGESGSSFADELPSGDLPLSSAKVQSPLEGSAAKLEVPLNELGSFIFPQLHPDIHHIVPPKKRLVVWKNFYFFHNIWEFHHPNWRTPSFFRGVGQAPTRKVIPNIQW